MDPGAGAPRTQLARLVGNVVGQRMLDVEYLLNPPAGLERTIVYQYRSGMLRGALRRALNVIAERDGNLVFHSSPSELPLVCGGGGLFSGIAICDWSEAGGNVSEVDKFAALEAICLPESRPVEH